MKTMESKHKRKLFGSLKILMAASLVMLMAAPAALAQGTASGTTISNTATIDYEVLGSNQPDITSAATEFEVDNRVDLTVASLGPVNVAAGQTDAALAFTVTNNGNTTQRYRLTAVNAVANIPMDTPVEIFFEASGAGFDRSDDTAYNPAVPGGMFDLAADASMTVYIVATAPAGATSGNIDTWWLRATTTDAGTNNVTPDHSADVDVPGTVQNVWADGDAGGGGDALEDGQHAAGDNFVVVAASLSITKSSAVIDDPINGAVNPKAIPGATIEYTVEISNATGATLAENIVLTDDLSALVTGAPADMVFDVDGYGGGLGMRIRVDTGGGYGAWTNVTNIGTDSDGDWNVTAANTVTVDCGDLNADDSVQVQFRLTVRY